MYRPAHTVRVYLIALLAGWLLHDVRAQAGVDLLHVPYKGAAHALPDLLGGRIHLLFDAPAMSLPHIRAGKIKALAVTSPKRIALLPHVPTAAEAGLPG